MEVGERLKEVETSYANRFFCSSSDPYSIRDSGVVVHIAILRLFPLVTDYFRIRSRVSRTHEAELCGKGRSDF